MAERLLTVNPTNLMGNTVLNKYSKDTMIGIYKITNLINGKIYIGQSIDIERRFWDHRCISHESNRHLKHALQKYGKENFKYEVLEECQESELDVRERYYIETLKPEYNVTNGGQDSLRRYPEEVREKISEKSKEQWNNMTDEERQRRISHNLTGHRRGYTMSEETKAKIRDKNLGKKQSLETIEKRKQTMLKKKQNGYRQTNSSHMKKVKCIETDEVFKSVKDAAESIGANPSSVSSMLKGRQKTVRGFHFEYLEV